MPSVRLRAVAVGEDVHQLGGEVRVAGGGGNVEHRLDRADDFQILLERLGGVDQHVARAVSTGRWSMGPQGKTLGLQQTAPPRVGAGLRGS